MQHGVFGSACATFHAAEKPAKPPPPGILFLLGRGGFTVDSPRFAPRAHFGQDTREEPAAKLPYSWPSCSLPLSVYLPSISLLPLPALYTYCLFVACLWRFWFLWSRYPSLQLLEGQDSWTFAAFCVNLASLRGIWRFLVLLPLRTLRRTPEKA